MYVCMELMGNEIFVVVFLSPPSNKLIGPLSWTGSGINTSSSSSSSSDDDDDDDDDIFGLVGYIHTYIHTYLPSYAKDI